MTESLSAVQVANSLLKLGAEYNVDITNLSLQKLLFFVQGFYYLKYDSLLFNENIEAWELGPVVPDIYHQFKKFGRNPIVSELACYFDPSQMDEASFPVINKITNPDAFMVTNDAFALLGGKDPFKLVQYSHRENSPWKSAISKNENKITPCLKIQIDEAHKEYFKSVFKEVKDEYDAWAKEQMIL